MSVDPHRVLQNIELIEILWRSSGIQIDYEKILERSYRTFLKPGDTILDVGAHNGWHTERFLEIVGPTGCVYAFEPLPDVRAALAERFAGRNANLRTFELALS